MIKSENVNLEAILGTQRHFGIITNTIWEHYDKFGDWEAL